MINRVRAFPNIPISLKKLSEAVSPVVKIRICLVIPMALIIITMLIEIISDVCSLNDVNWSASDRKRKRKNDIPRSIIRFIHVTSSVDNLNNPLITSVNIGVSICLSRTFSVSSLSPPNSALNFSLGSSGIISSAVIIGRIKRVNSINRVTSFLMLCGMEFSLYKF